MIDTRAVGQELQDQVLAAARKGHRRVTNTVKNVTATAQMIRPQLPSMPTINPVKLPNAEHLAQLTDKQVAQLREKAPALIGKIPNAGHFVGLTEKQLTQLWDKQLSQLTKLREKQLSQLTKLREKAPGLIKLPNAEHLAQLTDKQVAQLREKAPALIGKIPNAEHFVGLTEKHITEWRELTEKQITEVRDATEKQITQLREKAPDFMARFPSSDQLMVGAHDVAGQVRSARRQVVDQVRTVATPLAQQAAAAFSQATASTSKTSPAAVTHNGTADAAEVKPASENGKAASATAAHHAKPASKASQAVPTEKAVPLAKKTRPARPASRRTASAPKKAKPAAK